MRRIKIYLAACFALSICALALAEQPIVDLKVRRLRTMNKRTTNWSTDYGSFDKDKTQQVDLELQLRNLSRKPREYRAVISFLVIPPWGTKNTREYRVYRTVETNFNLDPMGSTNHVVNSQFMRSNRTVFAGWDQEYRSGNEFSGWVVWLFAEDEIVKVAASSKPIELMATENGISAWPEIEERAP